MERPPSPNESESKKFPTKDEILEVFEKLRGGRPVEFAPPLADMQGDIAILTMTVSNSDGTREEFQYQRIVDIEPTIMVVDVQKDASPSVPAILAEYRHGKWETREGVLRRPVV